jgi:hypothetical protein
MIVARRDPKPPTFDRRLHKDPQFQRQFKRWAERLAGEPGFRPEELSAQHYDFIRAQIVQQRGGGRARELYERKRVEMTPVLAIPDSTEPIDDLHEIWALPEMQHFWADWQPSLGTEASGKRRGPKANWAAAKAIMSVLGMTGVCSHLEDAHSIVAGRGGELREMFQSLERLAQGRAVPSLPGFGAQPVGLQIASYKTVARLIGRLGPDTIRHASLARMRLLMSLREHHPRVGTRWLIDGTHAPAWTRQVGAQGGKGSPRDLQLRGRCPDAGFRLYKRVPNAAGGKARCWSPTRRGRCCARRSSRPGAATTRWR